MKNATSTESANELQHRHPYAFERGQKDCLAYYAEPGRGHPNKNNYASNPYYRGSDEWKAYNVGWNTSF
mgnify:CR=1 FL=1